MNLRRLSAGLLALTAFGTLIVRIWLNMETHGTSLPEALWSIYRYFTIWTTTLICFACCIVAVRGTLSPRLIGGLLLAMSAVGIVYHTLLAHLSDFSGIDLVLDESLHTVIPLWIALHWLVLEPKSTINWHHIPVWLSYPLVYCVYALARAAIDGKYPYHFLDIADQGPAAVARNMVGLLFAFAVAGAVIVVTAKVLSRLFPNREMAGSRGTT